MRNPDRIEPFVNKIGVLWKENFPDWRFGQLISNVAAESNVDIFFLEEDKFMEVFEKFINTYNRKVD